MLKENENAKIKSMNLGYVIIFFFKEKGCQRHSLSHVRMCSLQGGLCASEQGQAHLGISIALEAFLNSHVID